VGGRLRWAQRLGIAPHSDDLPSDQRDLVEAQDLLDMLEHEVIPSYFDAGPGGYSLDWVRQCKASMYTVLPRFSAERMVLRYAEDIYAPAASGARELTGSTVPARANSLNGRPRCAQPGPA